MSWWKRFWRGVSAPSSDELLQFVRLTTPEWSEEAGKSGMRVWRNSPGDVLSLAILGESSRGLPELSDMTAVQQWFRSIAEERAAGLIEVRVVAGTIRVIHKRLEKPAYIFTGSLFMPRQEACLVWTLVSGERGTTGVREAVVAAELFNAGKLTKQNFERSWAQDPYDASYRGVARSVLRFISDDEIYDERFPEHPLSKIRRILATLPASVQVASGGRWLKAPVKSEYR